VQKCGLLSEAQYKALFSGLRSKFGLPGDESINKLPKKSWSAITRQVYASLQLSGKTDRVDMLNGNYGLCRGIVSALVVLIVLLLWHHGMAGVRPALLLLLGLIAAIYRMHRFGRYYARELFVAFLQALVSQKDAVAGRDDGGQPSHV
jgi:hypothetical protein